jgi:hypothetical protein
MQIPGTGHGIGVIAIVRDQQSATLTVEKGFKLLESMSKCPPIGMYCRTRAFP